MANERHLRERLEDALGRAQRELEAERRAHAAALTTARIDGARAFAEWCEACGWLGRMDPNRGVGTEVMSELVRRWLASESKEG